MTPKPTETNHLKLAHQYMEKYEHRINQDSSHSTTEDRQAWEDRAYKQAMMHAAYASAEAATRQAEVAESFLEFMSEFVSKTDLTDALIRWSHHQ
jgi:hypothetical protein